MTAIKNNLVITYPEDLPVSARRDEIARAIEQNQVVIVCGETGSGKTTQLPKICLELGRGQKKRIGHTQPRRIAASSTARRIAKELNTPLGETVGYKIRFTDKLNANSQIKLMTDGILLAETLHDRLLKQYDTLIIDEAHERSLNIDFLLGYLKEILPKRPDLKIIITSATIDANRFAEHFAQKNKPAPIIEVSGRLYPVEIRYRPILEDSDTETATRDDKQKRDLMDAIADAVDELWRIGSGDILVFLPGEREIREATDVLRHRQPQHVQILPLFARLSAQEQEKIFKPTVGRRIVLATNVAETSLTVPGIRFVIDTGLARVKRYSFRNKVEQLHIESIAQSAANQRAGRCGRVASGVCIRLYDEQDFALRPQYTTPEILRSSLASVILRMTVLELGDIETFAFMQSPSKRAIADGYQLLHELGALDDKNKLTAIGRQLSLMPLDPRIARMLLAAKDFQCLTEMLIIASALAIQDPRDRPMTATEAADNAHKKFVDTRSEFLSFMRLWDWFEQALTNKKSNRLLQEKCRENFLSYLRLREWRDVHTQLSTLVEEQKWRKNTTNATYEQIHMALLTGLLGNIGCKSEDASVFLGARGIKFNIWPGSALFKKNGRWIMAAELVDTSRLYARCIAQIQPEWLEKVGTHLLRKSWSDPHWEKKPAQVIAFERATLYGLVVYNQRRVHFGRIDPVKAREIFIREALVQGDFVTTAPFFAHNQRLIDEIENLEHKSRRTDVLVDESLMHAFYDKLLAPDIINGAAFEKWHKQATKENPRLLFLNREDLMRHEAAGITTDQFPKKLTFSGIDLSVDYHFEPGNARDGITLNVPIYILNQIDESRCQWLVPGMIKEKIIALLKSLPQRLRRHCVPLPDYASAFLTRQADIENKHPLLESLIEDLHEQCAITVSKDDFRLETLPQHQWMNFRVIDEHGRMLAMSRNLSAIKSDLGKHARNAFQQLAQLLPKKTSQPKEKQVEPTRKTPTTTPSEEKPSETIFHGEKITDWTFDTLPEILEIKRGKQSLIGYPALIDKTTHCEIAVFDDPEEAKRLHRVGLRRLFALQVKEQLKYQGKHIEGLQQISLLFVRNSSQEELKEQILNTAMDSAFLLEPLPVNAAEFNKRKDEGKSRLGLLCNEIARLVLQVLTEYHNVKRKLSVIKAHKQTTTDIDEQLAALMTTTFIVDYPYDRLKQFSRYLKACAIRIDKCQNAPQRDMELMRQWQQAATPFFRENKHMHKLDTEMQAYRWLLEELRVSLFAQELKTPFPVSVKRLQKVWDSRKR